MGSLKPQTIILERSEIDCIHSCLKRGLKRKLAFHLGISPPLLSRYLNYRYNKYFDGFKMPRDVYTQIRQFMETSTTQIQ